MTEKLDLIDKIVRTLGRFDDRTFQERDKR